MFEFDQQVTEKRKISKFGKSRLGIAFVSKHLTDQLASLPHSFFFLVICILCKNFYRVDKNVLLISKYLF